ncbi:hypothetical protein [Rhodococcus marinonascens]|uniref:hypothetical protein n=1 Tax=Rhodococcus marinonascens TaxID=38311 RepID=UPI000A02BD9A|nr:hypothetical protein [Rhodococcus marinonascens]
MDTARTASAEHARLEAEFGALNWDDVERKGRSGRVGLTEARIAKALGVEAGTIDNLAWYLWRRSFSDERDHRAGQDANAQKRGRITRELKSELSIALEKVSRGDD